MPNLDDIIWGAMASRDPEVLPEAFNSKTNAYLDAIGNEDFLEMLRFHPRTLKLRNKKYFGKIPK